MTHTDRHPSTVHLMKFFTYGHLSGYLQPISRKFCELAHELVLDTPDSPELTAALRKLLEAKDCAVRAAVDLDTENYTDR